MLTFKEFLKEGLKDRILKSIHGTEPHQHIKLFDLDDTLATTHPDKNGPKIRVMHDGNHVKSLSPSEFNGHKLDKGQSYDFGEFADSYKFAESASPIHKMVRHVQRSLAAGNHVHILTARSDMRDHHIFLGALDSMGIDTSRVHVHRAGNEGKNPTEVNKARKLHKVLGRLKDQGHDIRKVTMYDDHHPNVTTMFDADTGNGQSLRQNHPNVNFNGVLVSHKGQQVKVKKVAE